MAKKITELTADTSPTSSDVMVMVDVASGTTKKVTVENLFGNIPEGAVTVDNLALIPAFCAHLGANQSVPSATYTKLNLTSEAEDVTNNYDAASSEFVAPVAGIYHFDATAGTTVAGAIALYVNGVRLRRSPLSSSSSLTSPLSTDIALQAGDSVEAYVYLYSASNVMAGSDITFFNGHLVTRTG